MILKKIYGEWGKKQYAVGRRKCTKIVLEKQELC